MCKSWGGPGTEQTGPAQGNRTDIWIDGRREDRRGCSSQIARIIGFMMRFSRNGEYLMHCLNQGLRRCRATLTNVDRILVIADLPGARNDQPTATIQNSHAIWEAMLTPRSGGKNPIPPEQWADGQIISPHCSALGCAGVNLYVAEWLFHRAGSLKLKRVEVTGAEAR
jgi:hypothetical protein